MENYQAFFDKAALMVKCLRGQATEQDMKLLEEWFVAEPRYRKLFQKLSRQGVIEKELEAFELDQKESDWLKILARIENPPVVMSTYSYRRLFRYAAVLALITGAVIGVYNVKLSNSIKKDNLRREVIASILPGQNKAVLLLADGRRIVLDQSPSGEIARESNAVITKVGSNQLLYGRKHTPGSLDKVSYNTLVTPRGGQFSIVLPDGSKVWLNAASSLKYPTSFESGRRLVELHGEAYFEIKSINKGKHLDKVPFFVISGEQMVEVLGTHFNVSSYADEKTVRTTLLEGQVKVTRMGALPKSPKMEVLLNPGEQSVMFSRGVDQIDVHEVDTQETVAWTNGQFQFRDADLPTIMRQISRWYDVEVEFQGKVPDAKFRGKISRDIPISQLFEILKISGVDFKTEGRKIIIRS